MICSAASVSLMGVLTKSLLFLGLLCLTTSSAQAWAKAGCHRLGHTREVTIPDCVPFTVTTNACRGFCTSYAFPSPSWVLEANPHHMVTSRAECCSIVRTHDVHVNVRCRTGMERKTFKSAAECACDVCRNG